MATTSHNLDGARYEFRVWGKHRKACRVLSKLATAETTEQIEDCYVLVSDPAWNAKVRDSRLKLKQLVGHRRGFERWVATWHRAAHDTPAPFDELYSELELDRVRSSKKFSLPDAVASLEDDSDTKVLFVTKHRRRYRIGSIKAEVTKIDVEGSDIQLRTVAIEGGNLKDLVALRRRLGLENQPNVPMHVALEDQAA